MFCFLLLSTEQNLFVVTWEGIDRHVQMQQTKLA